LQHFLDTEASGGIILLAAAVAALVWANSPWSGSYDRLWHTELTIGIADWSITEDLQHWINDALMAIFFFVVGLEIKRELVVGELRDRRSAALPVFAALGGMVAPALIYIAINAGGPGADGWGIPVATDIAFAVGLIAIAGRGLPSNVRLMLLTLAIVDDIGAILVIAIFYSTGIGWGALGAAVALLATIKLLERLHVRWIPVYVILAAGVWLAFFESGVHATIAGVVLGLLTPARPFQDPDAVSREARRVTAETADERQPPDEDVPVWLYLSSLTREAVAPLDRFEHTLHLWTSFAIMPLFALANAGIEISAGTLGDAFTNRTTIGIVAGLVVGKLVGVTGFAWLATKLRIARLPQGVSWPHVMAVGAVAGIGFTVSLFIASLAFSDPDVLEPAKLGVFAASVIAGVVGTVILRSIKRRDASPDEPATR
jgi:NhaA family Na+:H+ antiporter